MNKIVLSLLSVGFFIGTFSSYGQSGKTWIGFSDEQKLSENFESKTQELLKHSTYLGIKQAATELAAAEGAKIKIPLIEPRKQVLESTKIANLLGASFVSFATAFDCGSCHRTHLNVASGYIISADGLIVTNYHVVKEFVDSEHGKNLAMSIQTHDGEVFLVNKIISCFKDADLAIVKVDTKGKALIPMPLGNTAQVGEDVFVMSNPAPMIHYFTTGKVARNHLSLVSETNKLPQTDITADYAAGSSGAPIVDRFGNLVSTVSSTRSIYYDMKEQKSLQMVVKNTIPVVLLKELIVFPDDTHVLTVDSGFLSEG